MFPALLIVHFEISIVSTLISLAGHGGNLVGNNIEKMILLLVLANCFLLGKGKYCTLIYITKEFPGWLKVYSQKP